MANEGEDDCNRNGGEDGRKISIDEQWKSVAPIFYDWLAKKNLVWPSLSCGWGPLIEQATHKHPQLLYLSEQTDGSVPSTLVIANAEVFKPRIAVPEHILQFNEEAPSPFARKFNNIIHPGELQVNRIRELPQNSNIVATHTDSPEVLIWDADSNHNHQAVLGAAKSSPDLLQVNRIREIPQNNNIVTTHTDSPDVLIWDVDNQPNQQAVPGAAESSPDLLNRIRELPQNSKVVATHTGSPDFNEETRSPLVRKFKTIIHPGEILTGHEDNAEFDPAAMCSTEPFVLSGGKDKSVVLWSIHDHVSTLATEPGSTRPSGTGSNIKTTSKTSGDVNGPAKSPTDGPRGIYKGHADTVEDVQFCPTSGQQFCSVGDDSCLILCDARTGTSPVIKVNNIREIPQNNNIVATHTDSPDVLIWDVDNQPNQQAVLGASESSPDLTARVFLQKEQQWASSDIPKD